jgi:predicted nuclease of predicted toxin-antitoxin system
MKFLVDEGVDKPIVDLLRATGFDVHYILETDRGIDDDKVLQIANDEARILLTQDKDFGEMVFRLKKVHLGIILIRLGTNTSAEKARLVNHILLEYGERLENAFTVIQTNAIRIRKQNRNV